MRPFIPYARQSIDEEDIAAVASVLKSGTLTRGSKTEEFEEGIAEYCSVDHAVAFSSCTAALLAACHVAETTPYDRLVTTPNSFVATVAGAWHHGAEPLFIDIDPANGNLDLELVKCNIEYSSSRGKNIFLPMHYAGIPVDMQKLESMVFNDEDIIIEDAAHALGSSYPTGGKVGSCQWSHMTVFSFHPAKNITTGEGGMVLTHDEEFCRLLKRFRNNGIERDPKYLASEPMPWYYEVMEAAGNYHMTEMQAALGLSQLKRLDAFAAKRRALMRCYRDNLKGLPHLSFLEVLDEANVSFHLCVVKIDFNAYGTTREIVMSRLREMGIGTQVHYIPLYKHPFFREKHPDISSYFPKTEAFYSQALTLPLYSNLTEEEVRYVAASLKEVLCPVS